MKIKDALDFITDLYFRLADESDYEDELEEQFESLYNLVNSFKQEDTRLPAAAKEESIDPTTLIDWTRQGCVDCDD